MHRRTNALRKVMAGLISATALLIGTSGALFARDREPPRLVEGLPASLRLDQVQELGSHNSYKRYPSPAEEERIRTLAPTYWDGLAYGHPTLETQFALGIRQIEIDVAPDPQGGLYLTPYLDTTPEARKIMSAPGAKVLHVAQLDTETHCLTFRICLAALRRWSDAHPDHLPITVLVNSNEFAPIKGFWLHDVRFDSGTLDDLDQDILSVMGRERIITPDDVRKGHETLSGAVRDHAWPTLGAAKGKFLFVFDATGEDYRLYAKEHPSLKGRTMFGYYPEDSAEASIFNIQDPRGHEAKIRRLVKEGFLVRTRSDADVVEARAHDTSRLDAAIASGAQFVSTDFYDGAPNPQGFSYVAALPGTSKVRCDPLVVRCSGTAASKAP